MRNAGGGYVNHDLFFRTMSPNGGGEPDGLLLDGLKKGFGSFAQFKQMFTLAALEVFGSGWAWLYYDEKLNALAVTSTPNQDTPAMEEGVVSLLGLDVWEHAYAPKRPRAQPIAFSAPIAFSESPVSALPVMLWCAQVLPEAPEQSQGLHRGLVQRGELGGGPGRVYFGDRRVQGHGWQGRGVRRR